MSQLPPPSAPPPGWYQDPTGAMRWWDGQAWGQLAPVPTATAASAPVPVTQQLGVQPVAPASSVSDERTLAILAHVLLIFFGFLGPLIIFLITKPEQRYARHHAAEALNFSITLLLAIVACIVLVFVLIGIPLLLVVWIGGIVLPIMAAVAANRGEWYRYPLTIRMVPGSVG